MNKKCIIIIIIFLFQLTFISQGADIKEEIIRLCRNPNLIYQFMTDSNFAYKEVIQTIESDSAKFVNHKDYYKNSNLFSSFFSKDIKIILDTTLKTKWNQTLRFGEIRYIVLQGLENKMIYFLLVKEYSDWKVAAFLDEQPADLKEINLKNNNAEVILDRIINNPHTLLSYLKKFNNSNSNENLAVDKYQLKNWRNKQKFIKKNYSGAYTIEKDFSELIGHENKEILHKYFFVNNKDKKKPIRFEFMYDDSLNEYYLSELNIYRKYDKQNSFYGKKVFDTLSSKEIEKNWEMVNLIVKNPDTLKVMLFDSLLVIKTFGKDTVFQNNIINYIKTYFNDGYLIDWDIPVPVSDDRFVFAHYHDICLSDKKHIRKLYFSFTDVDDLYNFKLYSVYSHLKEIDGIDWENMIELN